MSSAPVFSPPLPQPYSYMPHRGSHSGASLEPMGFPTIAPKPTSPPFLTSPVLTESDDEGKSSNNKFFKKGRHGSTSLFSVPEDLPNDVGEQTAPPPPTKKRRDSALLLPTADPNLFLYGHRDSMQNLFAAPLPFIMQQQDQKEADLKCAKCHCGINNLIMIDCDRCHIWYHIRCIGLDPERIPVHWTCSSCA